MAPPGIPPRPGRLAFAALFMATPVWLVPAWAGPVYNVTELHILSGSSLDSADLVSLFYAGFRYAPDGQGTDGLETGAQGTDVPSLNGAGLPIPSFQLAEAGPDTPVAPETFGADAIAREADSGDRLFPVDALLSGDAEAVLFTTGSLRRDTAVFTAAGQLPGVPCERGPSGLALSLCPPPEQPGGGAESTLRFRYALYTQGDASSPDYFCANIGER